VISCKAYGMKIIDHIPRRDAKTLPRRYCQHVIRFNSTHVNVISYKPTRKVRPIFTKIPNALQRDVRICYTEFQLNWTINVESTDRNVFWPLSKIRFSLFRFSWKIHSLHKILWVSLVPLFFKLDENVEYVERFSFTSLKMYASYCTMKLKISLWHWVKIFCAEYRPPAQKKKKWKIRSGNSFTSLRKVRPSLNQFSLNSCPLYTFL
jgi:hypothetical protein